MRQNKEVEELQVEKQKLEKEVQNALDIFKNSKAPNVDEDMRLFVNTQKEYKKLILILYVSSHDSLSTISFCTFYSILYNLFDFII